jgi:DMSO/TMAO reductase YedYZ molybdopterin-dependent catalytic subunit
MDRRRFLGTLARAGTGVAAFSSLPPAARRAIAAASVAPPGVIVRNDWPEHWETSLEALDRSALTPAGVFFVRSHFPVPDIDASAWRLEVAGLARTPLSLALGELRALPARERECVLECAGNGRARYDLPSTSGTQWQLGAVGNARWRGVPLADVLKRAGIPAAAKHVWFECADRAPLDPAPRFLRSIPIEKAMQDVLLATHMNGSPLSRLHGAPLRAIVPGWFGMASAKWVTRIRLEAAPSDNHFMVRGYRYNYPGVEPADAEPVQALRVKSLITSPLDGAAVAAGPLEVRGFAWAGEAGVSKVDLWTETAESGISATPAVLAPAASKFAWRAWKAMLAIEAGQTLAISAHAIDGHGNKQPEVARVNAGGYGNNSIHAVSVHA